MNNMLIALQITALGMGLVFGAIILLWWMMNLLTLLTAEKEPASVDSDEATSGTVPAVMDDNSKAQAAAVAVAIALAEQQTTAQLFAEPPTTIVSAWQLGMRTRLMHQKGGSIKRPAR